MGLVGVGAGLGMALALAGDRILRSLLYGVGALDPVPFVMVPVLLLAVTHLAAYVPAHRASRVDPVKALKAEQAAWGVLREYSDGVSGPRRRRSERVPYPKAG